MNLNMLLILLLFTLLLASFPLRARADMAGTFAMKDLKDAFALSCHAQDVIARFLKAQYEAAPVKCRVR